MKKSLVNMGLVLAMVAAVPSTANSWDIFKGTHDGKSFTVEIRTPEKDAGYVALTDTGILIPVHRSKYQPKCLGCYGAYVNSPKGFSVGYDDANPRLAVTVWVNKPIAVEKWSDLKVYLNFMVRDLTGSNGRLVSFNPRDEMKGRYKNEILRFYYGDFERAFLIREENKKQSGLPLFVIGEPQFGSDHLLERIVVADAAEISKAKKALEVKWDNDLERYEFKIDKWN